MEAPSTISYLAIYHRHKDVHYSSFGDLDEAIEFLESGERQEQLYPTGVVSFDDSKRPALTVCWKFHEDEFDETVIDTAIRLIAKHPIDSINHE